MGHQTECMMQSMSLHRTFTSLWVLLLFLLSPTASSSQTRTVPCDELGLAEMQPSIAAKGRMQDVPDTKAAQRILKMGKRAIPALISCLTDERMTKYPVFQYWTETAVGDVAFVFLTDLFTDSTWRHSTLTGMPAWATIQSESPAGASAEQAWQSFVAKHGRKYVQDWWTSAWRENKTLIYWDESERCFKVK